MDKHVVGTDAARSNLHHIVLHLRDIVQDIEEGRRIESSSLELYHLPLASNYRADSHSIAPAPARFVIMIDHISGLEPHERHSGHSESRDRDLTGLAFRDRPVIVVKELHDQQFRLEMASVEIAAVREAVLHLSGRIRRIQLEFRPFLMYDLSESVQFECLRIAQSLADADAFPQ